MLYRLSRLSTDILSLIVYTDSSSLEYVYQAMIKEKFDIRSQYCVTAATERELMRIRSSVSIAPLQGKRWLLEIDADKVDIRVLEKVGAISYDSCLVLYKTSKYGTYKRLLNSKFREAQGIYSIDLYGGRLDRRDIALIARHYDVILDEHIVKLLEHKYSRMPQSICSLCAAIKSGYCVESEKDVIDAVGIGSISTDEFVLSLLTVNVQTERGLKVSIKQKLMYLDSLAEGIPYSSIQNFIVDTLAGLIDIKTAMIAGEVSILNTDPPSGYTEKRAARFKRLFRYKGILESDISLEYLLCCYFLFKRNVYNPKMAIIEWMLRLYNMQDVKQPTPIQHIDTAVPLDASFDMQQYDKYGVKTPFKMNNKAAEVKQPQSTEANASLLSLLLGTNRKEGMDIDCKDTI